MDRILSSPLMILVYMFSAIAGVIVGLTFGGETFGVGLAVMLAFVFCLAIAGIEIVIARNAAGSHKPDKETTLASSTFIVGGKSYASVDEMPDDLKAVYQHTLALFKDADQDGNPDILEGMIPGSKSSKKPEPDRGDQLQEAKKMLEAGLISEDEYDATIKQIGGYDQS